MMRLLLLFCLTLLSCLLSAQPDTDFDDIVCKEAESHSRIFETTLFANPLTEDYDLKYYRFEWYIDPAVYFIEGTATAYFQTLVDDFGQIHFDFAAVLTISEVRYHGQSIGFTQSGDYLLTIPLPASLAAGTLDSISITYSGAPPSNGFGSFEQDEHSGAPIIWTLSEPFGTQDWWPCKNGLSDKLDSIDVIITTPEAYRAASNGLLVNEYQSGTDKVYHWEHNYAITPYLVAISVTNYVQYTDTIRLGNGTDLPMLNYVYPEGLTAAQTGTADLIQVMQYFDSLFITYPFHEEKYGHAQWDWGGGEEHQTMSFVSNFGWTLLSHELAHQWFGDLVTCGSWEDIWLNEGFATYLEGLSRERFLGADSWNAWKTSRVNTITSQPGGAVKVNDTTSVNRIFNGRLSYSKGAYLLHMLRWKLGEEDFYQGIRNYLIDNEFDYAKTPNLKAHLEAASGIDLTEFFEDWYAGEGYPTYTVTWDQTGDVMLIQLDQTTSHPSVDFFEMPIPIVLHGDGVDTTIRLDHTESGQLFVSPVSFAVTAVEFDPERWLISRDNVVQEGMLSAVTQGLSGSTRVVLYPNPVTDILYLDIEEAQAHTQYRWEVINSLGQQCDHGLLHAGTIQIDCESLNSGLYHIIIREDHGGMKAIGFIVE